MHRFYLRSQKQDIWVTEESRERRASAAELTNLGGTGDLTLPPEDSAPGP